MDKGGPLGPRGGHPFSGPIWGVPWKKGQNRPILGLPGPAKIGLFWASSQGPKRTENGVISRPPKRAKTGPFSAKPRVWKRGVRKADLEI